MKSGSEILSGILTDLSIKLPTLAKKINVPYRSMFDIQKGKVKRLSPSVAKAINKVYPQYSLEYLLGGDVPTNNISGNNNNNIVGNSNNVNDSTMIAKILQELAGTRKQVDDLIEIVKQQLDIIKNK